MSPRETGPSPEEMGIKPEQRETGPSPEKSEENISYSNLFNRNPDEKLILDEGTFNVSDLLKKVHEYTKHCSENNDGKDNTAELEKLPTAIRGAAQEDLKDTYVQLPSVESFKA